MTRRSLHPLAWWIWALSLGAAALRTTNPLLLGLLVAAAWFVVAARRPEAPWARSFRWFLQLGVVIIVVRVVFEILFGARLPGEVLFTLPQVELPSWAAGVSLGGPVTAERLVVAFTEGLQLATLLACIGAANSLASPYRLLRSLPSVLYELGVVVTVALSFAPQTSIALQQVRDARRLRGRPSRGLRGLRGLAIPVLEGALERSLDLAASMDSRGYGRRGTTTTTRRRVGQWSTLLGAFALTVGAFGVLDVGSPAYLGVPLLVLGGALIAVAVVLANAAAIRSRYRPDPWRLPEWLTCAAGVGALLAFVIAGRLEVAGLAMPISPLEFPTLPLLPTLGILLATLPAYATPALPAPVTS
jgi:energy-coupling factor transport system permease protein